MRSMTRLISLLVASLATTGNVCADTRLTTLELSVIAIPGAPLQETSEEYTLWLREDRSARVGAGQRMVVRLDRGESYFIDDAQKTASIMPFDGLPEGVTNATPFKPTGETRTVGAWTAERYEGTIAIAPGETGTMVLWVSADVGVNLDAYRAFARNTDHGDGILTAIAALPGYPVMQEMTFGDGAIRATVTLLEVSEDTAPAGTYDLPADYARR